MAALIIAEVLDRHGHLQERVRIEQLPATIGTAYTSDIIVSDPYVAPCEARIEQDEEGRIHVVPADSINGLLDADTDTPTTHYQVHSGGHLQVGQTLIRLMLPDHPVEPAKPFVNDLITRLSQRFGYKSLLFLFILALGFVLLQEYLSDFGEFSTARFAFNQLPIVFYYLGAAGVWAAATRLVSRHFRFGWHLAILALVTLLYGIGEVLLGYIEYIFTPDTYWGLFLALLGCTLMASWLFAHLYVVSTTHLRFKWIVAVLLSLSTFIVPQLEESLVDEHYGAWVEYPSTIKPLPASLLYRVDMSEYFTEVDGLQVEVDELAMENK